MTIWMLECQPSAVMKACRFTLSFFSCLLLVYYLRHYSKPQPEFQFLTMSHWYLFLFRGYLVLCQEFQVCKHVHVGIMHYNVAATIFLIWSWPSLFSRLSCCFTGFSQLLGCLFSKDKRSPSQYIFFNRLLPVNAGSNFVAA